MAAMELPADYTRWVRRRSGRRVAGAGTVGSTRGRRPTSSSTTRTPWRTSPVLLRPGRGGAARPGGGTLIATAPAPAAGPQDADPQDDDQASQAEADRGRRSPAPASRPLPGMVSLTMTDRSSRPSGCTSAQVTQARVGSAACPRVAPRSNARVARNRLQQDPAARVAVDHVAGLGRGVHPTSVAVRFRP